MDFKNRRNLLKLIQDCRKNGIKSLKIQGDSLEIQFSEDALFPQSAYQKKKQEAEANVPLVQQGPVLTNEDVLLWSSAGIPDEFLMKGTG